jgi:hypothetical protein
VGGDAAHRPAAAGPLDQVRQRVGAKTGPEAVDADLDPVAAPVDWSKGDEDALAPDMGAAVRVLDDRVAGGDEGQQSNVGESVGDGSLDAAPDRPASGRLWPGTPAPATVWSSTKTSGNRRSPNEWSPLVR